MEKIVGIGLPQGSPPSFFPVKGVCKLRPRGRAPPVAGIGQNTNWAQRLLCAFMCFSLKLAVDTAQ